MKFLVVFVLFIFSLSSYSVESKSITYYVIADSGAPFQISNGANRPDGIVSDILYSITSKGVEISPKSLPFKRMIQEMNSKGIAQWVSYGSKKWSGPQSDVLSQNSLITIKHKILTLKKNKYQSVEDLFGKRLAFIRGFQYPGLGRYIKDKSINIIEFPNHKAAIKAVEIGRVYGFPEMGIRLKYHINKNNFDEGLFLFNDISKVIKDYDINFCFSRDFPKDLISEFDQKIKLMKESGKIDRIIHSYTNDSIVKTK